MSQTVLLLIGVATATVGCTDESPRSVRAIGSIAQCSACTDEVFTVRAPLPDVAPTPTPIATAADALEPVVRDRRAEAAAPRALDAEAIEPAIVVVVPAPTAEETLDGLMLAASLAPQGHACISGGGLLAPTGAMRTEGDEVAVDVACACGGAQ